MSTNDNGKHKIRIFANLQLLKKVKKNQCIRVTSNYNISNIIDYNFYNNMKALCYLDMWGSTIACLDKLFGEDIPQLQADLIEHNKVGELLNLRSLLIQSIIGLKNMKDLWYNDNLKRALFNTYINECVTISINNIQTYFDENQVTYPFVATKSE